MGLAVVLDVCTCCGDLGPDTCEEICDVLPTSITVTVSGLESDFAWCGDPSAAGTCIDDFNACIAGAADCTAECDCAAARDECLCQAVQDASTDKCVETCPCDVLNGDWVLEPTELDPCTYEACVSFCEPDYSSVTDPRECPLTDCSTVCFGGGLIPLGGGYTELQFNPPWTHATVSYWTSGPILATTLCAGGTIALNPEPSGTVYADEVNMGCGCGTDHSFTCGDVPWVCSQDPFTTCDDTSQPINCDYASHALVTVSNAAVTV